ncbi:uro-adherence factor A-like [Palaemon carinicauda]|uniref:uro-adherence factor A-like n=1 Tax=Palaemon carinicauda TaxID=392227 RepID=UPI0035B640D8
MNISITDRKYAYANSVTDLLASNLLRNDDWNIHIAILTPLPPIHELLSLLTDPNEMFAGEPGGPPLAGVVMQQAYPGGPMITIPVHWTPFIDPTLIPGETALTPLDPAFTHVIDPKALPIDPLHILPVQHDASGCPVHVQVKVDSNGVPIQIQPTAFTVSLSSLHQHQEHQQGIIPQQHPQLQQQHQPEGHHAPQPEVQEVQLQQGEAVVFEGACQEPSAGEEQATEEQTRVAEQQVLEGQTREDQGVVVMEVEEVTEQTGPEEVNRQETDEADDPVECSEDTETVVDVSEENSKEMEETQGTMETGEEEEEVEEEEEEEEVVEEEVVQHEETIAEVEEKEEERQVEPRMEATEEVEESMEEETTVAAIAVEKDTDNINKNKSKASKDTALSTTTAPAAAATESTTPLEIPAVPSTSPQEVTPSSAGGEAKRRGASDEEEEEEEAEEEEDMLTKEAEESSDSSDSQTFHCFLCILPNFSGNQYGWMLYGYPVVVADQHQHQQRGYSKRKKKKYQRRRHAEISSSGCYLDPQLYTGEPFVATPGGYVVPVEAAPSVCQVHGFQYVTAPFPQHPDEGIVQHSPYLPGVLPDLAAQQVQHLGGALLDDGSKRIFSDLQEKERRQIQEILQEQRAKVGKSDSTESSDSGVSESEEAVPPEFSSDEHDAHNKDQDSLQSSENTDGSLLAENASGAQCDVDTSIVEISEGFSSEESLERNINEKTNSEINVSKDANLDNAQYKLSGDNSIKDSSQTTDDQNQLICDNDASIQPESDLIENCTTAIETDNLNQNFTSKDTQNINSSCKTTNANIEYCAQEQSTSGSSDSDVASSEDVTQGTTENLDDLGNKSELDLIEASRVSCNLVNGSDNAQLIASSNEQHNKEIVPQNNTTQVSKESSFRTENSELTLENAQEYSNEEPTNVHEPIIPQRIESLPRENSLEGESLKDLKVTEAVKRWIREVTPEKAFFLSEVQTRLLENEIQEEMDTEDEYIEDELPQSTNVRNSKNVEGNPFAAASSDAPIVGMESCSKRVALSNKQRGISPDTLDDYDGSSTISNLSNEHLYSEASSSQPASFSHSFDEEEVEKYTENPNIYNPIAFAKYYQLGIEVDETTPAATPIPQSSLISRETTPVVQMESETVSECGSEDIETIPHKYDVVCQYTATSPMSLATEILKAEKVLSNMTHITGSHKESEASKGQFGNPDIYLKHYGNTQRTEVGDSGVQSEESSDEMEGRSNVGSSGVGSSLASTPAISPAHQVTGQHTLQPHPLRNLSAGDGPVPCRTVCCAVM